MAYSFDQTFAPTKKNGVTTDTPWQSFREVSKQDASDRKNPRGWKNPLPYERQDMYVREFSGKIVKTFQGQPEIWTGNLNGMNPLVAGPNLSFDDSLRARTEVAALLKVKDQSFNLAQAYGERQQTINLVASNISRLAGAFGDIRRGNVAKALSRFGVRTGGRNLNKSPMSLEKAGATWLELQYGWKPLLSDIHGAGEALSLFDGTNVANYGVTVKAKRKTNTYSRNWVQGVSHGEILREVARERGCFVRLDYIPKDLTLQAYSSLGLANPASLAWELLPFSFVVDWALPVGDWLSSFDAGLGFNFRTGSLSQFARWTEVQTLGGTFNCISAQGSAYCDGYKLSRTVYASPPSPMSTFPGLKNPFSLTHLANAMALLATNFGRVR